jgi:hypothetical protein
MNDYNIDNIKRTNLYILLITLIIFYKSNKNQK